MALPVRTVLVPPIILGTGAAARIGEEAKKLGLKNALIITDRVMAKLPAMDSVKSSLMQSGLAFEVYEGANVEPTLEIVREGLEAFRKGSCDFAVALGGGSAIDAAKAVCVMATNPGPIESYMGAGKIPKEGAPFIAVPTTAGTGSEVTPYTIITDTRRTVKMLISSRYLIPSLAIVDPQLTLSCPPGITASVGMDALTHAIEAYVSLRAQPMTDIFCISAIELLAGNLREAWANGNNLEAREKTMLGALQAGIAFSNSSVALVHGMSRPIGAYFHMAHGASNAALLATVMEFSYPGNLARYADIARAMGEDTAGKTDIEAAELAVKAVQKLTNDIKVSSLRQLGVPRDKLEQLAPQMAEDAIASGSPGNNPRQASKEQLIELYMKAYSL